MADSFKTALRTLLAGDPTVAGLVGDKIRPEKFAQEDSLPGLLIEVDKNELIPDLNGTGDEGQALVTLACCAFTDAEAEALGQAVHNVLANYRGTVGSVEFAPILVTEVAEEFEPATDGSDESDWYLRLVRLDIFYRRSL